MSSSSTNKQLYLIDGNAYMYRSFYAIRDLTTSQGVPTNALYGFIKMVLKLLREQSPSHLAVAFDVKGPTKRHEEFEQYKAQRKPMPEELVPQMQQIREILEAFRIPIFQGQGYEADDFLASLAKNAVEQGFDVTIVTGDKDMLQLVNDHIRILSIHKDNYVYDTKEVVAKYGIKPEHIVDFLGLAGDSSDNIPGVPGVGAKTATRLIQQFGSVEDIIASVDKIKSPSQKKKIQDHADQALLSKALATLDDKVEGCEDIEACHVKAPDAVTLHELFRKFEFYSFIREMGLQESADQVAAPQDVLPSLTMKEVSSWMSVIKDFKQGSTAVLLRQDSVVAVYDSSHNQGYVCFWTSEDDLKILLQAPLTWVGYDLKAWLKSCHEFSCSLSLVDLKLAAYLVYPGKSHYRLEDLSEEYAQQSWRQGESIEDWGHNLVVMHKLHQVLQERLTADGLKELYDDLEMPLLRLLAKIESIGVKVDVDFLTQMSQTMQTRLDELTAQIYKEAGGEFNINSPKQLAEILFEELGLPPSKKTKTGYSTSVEVLEKLAEEYLLPALILQYRQIHKLKSTYVDALPKLVDPQTGRVHTTLHQEVAATGRLSSSDPNLQNIPIRTAEGRDIRKAFVAGSKDSVLVAADYSQIELRVLAHLSQDETMIRAFKEGQDIHQQTAADVLGVGLADVTDDMRRMAKAINFGLIYGKTPFGLAKDLGIPMFQAKEFIEAYFANFPKVRQFMDNTIAQAKEDGCVRTMYGRVRYLPDINAKNKMVREFAERMAINSPVQGAAADIIKKAMLKVDDYLVRENRQTHLILQIHDELLFEVPRHELDQVSQDIQHLMEHVVTLAVPLTVNIQSGLSWAEAH